LHILKNFGANIIDILFCMIYFTIMLRSFITNYTALYVFNLLKTAACHQQRQVNNITRPLVISATFMVIFEKS